MSATPPNSPPALAAWETALSHGITPDRYEVLQDGNTLVVRLTETLVVRVLQDLTGPRAGADWFARETAIAAHLTQAVAPVIPLHPDLPHGPHVLHGHPLNCWEFVTVRDDPAPPAALAKSLHACHVALRTFREPLTHLAILHEASAMLRERALFTADVQTMLSQQLDAALLQLQTRPAQPLHGDAHTGNALNTTRGLLWTDWEDAFLGPVEWDIASLIWNARELEEDHAFVSAVLDAFREAGGKIDETILEVCMTARAAVMTAWYPILYPNPGLDRQEKLRRRIEWLAARA